MTTPQRRVHFNGEECKKPPKAEHSSSTPKSDAVRKKPRENGARSEANLITVAIRIRPLNNKELLNGHTNAIRINEQTKQISVTDKSNKALTFTCDHIITDQKSPNFLAATQLPNDHNLTASAQQKYVYECIGKPLLDTAFDGYNVSIFAYGQTGSGKTYSMIGTEKQPGLIPRFFEDLFERKAQRDQLVSSTHIEISYYEIYNEKIYDLLRNSNDSKEMSKNSLVGRNLQIRENPQTGPYIVDLLTLSAKSASDAKLWLDIGNKRRATACTNINQKSSRSHSVFQITITQTLEHAPAEPQGGEKNLVQLVTSRINLVDLAGSERLNSAFSSATDTFSSALTSLTSSRLKESTCINKSLLTLGKIICLLSERQMSGCASLPAYGNGNNAAINSSSVPGANGHLPYRESVLTWLLKESLGGNAKTAMLATANASSNYLDETICTLRYAAKTATIKNSAHLNRNFKRKFINEFGVEQEMSLALAPMNSGFESSLQKKNDELQKTLHLMECEWKQKLDEAERLKQKEIKDLEKSLIVLYEKETSAQNCCLINLNEDPLLSEKLIYVLKNDKSSGSETLIGSDRNLVNIHLSGALIAAKHCAILSLNEHDDEIFYLQQMDEGYETFLNGEVIRSAQRYLLSHGDRIIVGGSHFFRFNNPKMAKGSSGSANSSMSSNFEFKDYQFAKNEVERKQNELMQKKLNEVMDECKRDGDLKIKELTKQYEKSIQSIKNDYERENSARKAELEKIKAENLKKLKKIVERKILIETKINQVENQMLETNKEIDKHEKELFDESICSSISENAVFRTPAMANRRLINKLYSDKKNSTIKKNSDQEIVQFHANSNSLFSIALKVTEANKICCVLALDFEFKKYEVPNSEDFDNRRPPQAISVTDKRLNLITLWNMDTFDLKLAILRDQYSRYVEEGSVSSLNSNQNESIFLTDSSDEWQTIDSFLHKNETFSPRVIDHVINGSNEKKSFKRRLSYMNFNSVSQSVLPSLPVANESDHEDNADSSDFSAKKKCYGTPKIQNLLPVIPFTPGSVVKRKSPNDADTNLNSSFDLSNQLSICNAFVYATCRDALNDDDFQIEDEDEFLNDTEDEENSESAKNVRSIPVMDDSNLKSYARLIYDLNKLMDIHSIDKMKKFEMTKSMCSSSSLEEKSVDYLNHNNDQPLYCMKIVILYSQLSQFKPDYWSLHNDENVSKIKKVYSKIVKLLRALKESINCLFKGIENNLDSLIKSKYDLIITQVTKLFYLNGEYQLLICANTILNRTNYSLMMIDAKFLHEYSKGIDKQFEEFLNRKLNFKEDFKNPVVDYVKNIKKFWINTQQTKFDVENLPSTDFIIDYCNYVLQTHFRLSNVFKTFKRKNQCSDHRLKIRLNDQILELMYTIMTDSFTLMTTFCIDNSTEKLEVNQDNQSKWGESFEQTFKELKNYLKKECL